jgi:glycosyltransferase involved in cell wall biosynthesis
MRVLIAAASFSSQISGLQRHAFNVARCLLRHPDISAVELVVAPWQRELVPAAGLDSGTRLTTHLAQMEPTSLSRNLWYYQTLPELAASLHVDVAHLSYPVPVNASSFPCPTVVTLHDLYPYEIPLNFGFPKFIFNRLILQQCLRNVDAIACVSDITRARLRQYSSGPISRKAVRIYNCVEAELSCALESPIPGWQGEPFLLCVAQHRRNKNIPLLIRSFARLLRSCALSPKTKLVVVGIPGPETQAIHRLLSRGGLERSVHLLKGLSEAELQWCYARCEALVAPSRTEGFGLPVAEALLAGCRVICSDIPAHREVGHGHCEFVDLARNAEEKLCEGIIATLRMPATPPVSLPQFSSGVLAKQYARLYRSLRTSGPILQQNVLSSSLHPASSERQPS